ncbi:LacI family DNA-binding transcriptional regulator [Rhodopirellula halodulae]|uniref:LacI family DNA-binding transcriptional regulator n=1 Tax=Rhodopirellula halodulae TaxID=2894198 RepID=UPI001E4A366B|nr:LacI family DNA-binding transcriptional regulator [Rhodopirellula sp. JC737]MCC9656503.1 LacI family DNA-binding transcriptional regulator [Rhodopirellula sp. JC737]
MPKGRITIQDIADQAEVSKSTVSRVLNSPAIVQADKRDRVLATMAELGYQPNQVARSLAGGRSMTIGIVTQNIGTPFYDSVVQGVMQGLNGTGFSPIVGDAMLQQNLYLDAARTLLGRNVDGLVLIAGDIPAEMIDELNQQKPTLVVGREMPGWDGANIATNNFQIGANATQTLIDHGHQNIVHIAGPKDHVDAIGRLNGFRHAMQEAGLPITDDHVIYGDFHADSAADAIQTLQHRGVAYSAIFAANDLMAVGARYALYERGIDVPEQISLIGIDDHPESKWMIPPLTTVRQPATEMGQAAATAIIAMINDEKPTLPQLGGEVVLRKSVRRV